ncbi:MULTISPECIES: hypothetical protein [unclassified Neptuniibacter]|jgi:hypothetical protein|uniref:hypothetical protein n=1 Tax=unclassified Neptuniibacter TaxID=2630693 RepID=UPI0026E32831|nr:MULTISPECIES: hypothetical protein [unclassified Neptuniibacter]MDO6514001.1 hypothetical protein [Neptuniibacter sp. 2_MG-2023]
MTYWLKFVPDKGIAFMKGFQYLILSLLFMSTVVSAEITSVEALINSSSNQNRLSQEMLKNYILVGMSVRARKAEQDLNAAIVEYEAAEKEILNYVNKHASDPSLSYNTTDTVGDAFRKVSEHWNVVKPLYEQEPTKENVENVRAQTELLLKEWMLVTAEVNAKTESAYGNLISTAGFVRMLSQRVSSHYALRAWGFNDRYSEPFIESLQLFEQNRDALESSKLNSDQIKSELNKIQKDFKRFKDLSDMDVNKALLPLIMRSAEKITQSMDKVTAMYQGLSVSP